MLVDLSFLWGNIWSGNLGGKCVELGKNLCQRLIKMRVYKIYKNAIIFGVLCFFGGFAALAEGAENIEKAESAKSSQIAKQFEAIKESSQDSSNDSLAKGSAKDSTQSTAQAIAQTPPKPKIPTKIPTHKPEALNLPAPKKGLQDLLVMQTSLPQDFQEVQRSFPWIRYIGLAMVSFDDGSYRSGFGLLLPDKIFLTSAELAHNASAYPKEMLLKMRDDSAGNLICIAQLRLKALDKGRGLALFEVEEYTDDYCNIRAQSYYHARLMKNNAYDIGKPAVSASDYFTVTTTFNNPDISVLRVGRANAQSVELPIQNDQRVIFGRPFFSRSGVLLGMASMQENAFKPMIISNAKIKEFICAMRTSGVVLPASVGKICAGVQKYATNSMSGFGTQKSSQRDSIKNFVPKSKTDVQKFKEYLERQDSCLSDKAAKEAGSYKNGSFVSKSSDFYECKID